MTSPGEPWKWLESTRLLQKEAYGVVAADLGPAELADYVTENLLGLFTEVGEAAQEFQWKTWANNRGTANRSALLGEIVDALHFAANVLAAIDVTDNEFEAAYREKQARNRMRQQTAGGYDAKATKCPVCKRELDKPGAFVRRLIRPSHQLSSCISVRCAACDTHLGTQEGLTVTWSFGIHVPDVTFDDDIIG